MGRLEYTLPLSLLTPSPQTFPVCSTKIIKKIHINKLYGLKIKYFFVFLLIIEIYHYKWYQYIQKY
jgi:hypothetical protein